MIDKSDNISQDIVFQCIGIILVIIGSLLIYQGPKFLNIIIICVAYITNYCIGYQVIKSEYFEVWMAEIMYT